jgi:hypothetical protein
MSDLPLIDLISVQVHLNSYLHNLFKTQPPHQFKTASSKSGKKVKYVFRPGEVAGELRVVRGWTAIGREVRLLPLHLPALIGNSREYPTLSHALNSGRLVTK